MEQAFSEILQSNQFQTSEIIRELAENFNIAFQVTDQDGNFIEANPLCINFLEIREEALTTTNFLDLFSKEQRANISQAWHDLNESKSLKLEVTFDASPSSKQLTSQFTFYKLTSSLNHKPLIAGLFNVSTKRHTSQKDKHTLWNFEEIIAKSDEAIIQLDPDWKLIEINKKGLDFTGYNRNELLGTDLSQVIDVNYRQKTCEFYQIQREKHITTTVFEFPIKLKNGNQRWIRQKFHILYDAIGDVSGYLGLSNDITELHHLKKQLSVTDQVLEKRVNWRTKELEKINTKLRGEIELRTLTEEALRESEKEYRSLFQNANDAIIIIDAENEKILEVNDIACEIYGQSREVFLKNTFKDTLGSKAGLERNLIIQTLSQKKYYVGEIILDVNGEEIILDVHANEVIYQGRKAILSVNRDVTSKKRIQKELIDEKTRGMNALIDGQEMERRRLSRELHDGLGQLLTTSIIYTKQLKKKVDPESAEIAERINEILDSTIEEVRSISHNLMPSVLDDFGLSLALKNMVNNLKKNKETKINLLVGDDLPRLSPEAEVGLYRIAQEGLNNALKHAKDAEISIELKKKNNHIELSIEDSGDGFKIDSTYVQNGGNGIANMSQRANSIGGEFKIRSNKSVGTVINVLYNLRHE